MRRYTGLFLLLLAAPVHAASFDCASAKSEMEVRVCTNENLSRMDETLSIIYSRALAHGQNSARIRQEQRNWLKGVLNKCQSDECLAAAYQERITVLANLAQVRIYSDKALGIEFAYPVKLEVEKRGQSLYIQKRNSDGQVILLVDINIGGSIPDMVNDYPIRGYGWTGFIQVKPCGRHVESDTHTSGYCMEAEISDGKRHVSVIALHDTEQTGVDPGPILTSITLAPLR